MVFFHYVFDLYIFFMHKLNVWGIIGIIFGNYGFKFMFEVVTLPITYLLVYALSNQETSTSIKYINFKPHRAI